MPATLPAICQVLPLFPLFPSRPLLTWQQQQQQQSTRSQPSIPEAAFLLLHCDSTEKELCHLLLLLLY